MHLYVEMNVRNICEQDKIHRPTKATRTSVTNWLWRLLTGADSFDSHKCGKVGDNSSEVLHAIAVTVRPFGEQLLPCRGNKTQAIDIVVSMMYNSNRVVVVVAFILGLYFLGVVACKIETRVELLYRDKKIAPKTFGAIFPQLSRRHRTKHKTTM